MSKYFDQKDIEKLIIAQPEFQEQIGWNRAIHAVLSLQAADVKPAKYGSWVRGRCSNCHHMDVEEPDYCSRCGSCNGERFASKSKIELPLSGVAKPEFKYNR